MSNQIYIHIQPGKEQVKFVKTFTAKHIHITRYSIIGASVTNGIPDDPTFFIETDRWCPDFVKNHNFNGIPFACTGVLTHEHLTDRPITLARADQPVLWNQIQFTIKNHDMQTPLYTDIFLWGYYEN
jgi:hypothetical protein